MNDAELDAAMDQLVDATAGIVAAFDRLDKVLNFSAIGQRIIDNKARIVAQKDRKPTPQTAYSSMSKVTLTPEVRTVLERSNITAQSVQLPPEKLDPKLYKQVNAVIEAAGGKWNRKAQSHLFTIDPRAALGLALDEGHIIDKAKARKKERQAFYTPAAVANTVACLADVDGHFVLEPSAGGGALADACLQYGARRMYCIEIDPEAAAALNARGHKTVVEDFLQTLPEEPSDRFSRIVMNPPFTKKQDLKHVMHAFSHWLKLDGVLTAIVADDGQGRQDIITALGKTHPGSTFAIKERLPAGTFKESGTQIATLVIQISR